MCVALAVLAVYLWGAGQFDFGVGILSAVFFIGSTALWNQAVSGGAVCLVVFLYAWAGYFFYRGLVGEENLDELSDHGGLWFGIAGFLFLENAEQRWGQREGIFKARIEIASDFP